MLSPSTNLPEIMYARFEIVQLNFQVNRLVGPRKVLQEKKKHLPQSVKKTRLIYSMLEFCFRVPAHALEASVASSS